QTKLGKVRKIIVVDNHHLTPEPLAGPFVTNEGSDSVHNSIPNLLINLFYLEGNLLQKKLRSFHLRQGCLSLSHLDRTKIAVSPDQSQIPFQPLQDIRAGHPAKMTAQGTDWQQQK